MTPRPIAVRRAVGALVALVVSTMLLQAPAEAAQAIGRFDVVITLNARPGGPPSGPVIPGSAFCRTENGAGAFGATVTVVCSTGEVVDLYPGRPGMPWVPMHGGAYRYLVQATRGDLSPVILDTFSGPGTVTSWRVVHSAYRDYLELTVGW